MNLLGKIFVGILMAMSIAFFGLTLFLWNTPESWRAVAEQKDTHIKELQANNQKISQNNDMMQECLDRCLGPIVDEQSLERNRSQGSFELSLTALRETCSNIESENQVLLTNRSRIEKDLQEKMDQIASSNSVISSNRNFIAKMDGEFKNAQNLRSVYLRNLTNTVAEKYKMTDILSDMETQNAELLRNYDQAKTVLTMKGLNVDESMLATKPRYAVQGIIEAVQQDTSGLIMISIGSNDGLKPNHLLDISRENTYLGRVKVLATEPNRAVCRVIPEYRRGVMKQGDQVSSVYKN